MLVLRILGLLLVVLGLPYASYRLLRAFNERSQSLFGYSVVTVRKLALMGLACALFYVGAAWTGSIERLGVGSGDPLNGIVMLVLASVIALGLAYQNYRKTNPLFGTAATLVHVGLAPFALQFGIALALVAMAVLVAVVALAAIPRPVYVING